MFPDATGRYTTIFSDSGNFFLSLSEKIVVYLPVASGNIKEEFAKSNLYDFVQYLKENKKWENQIEEIVVCDDGEIELIPRVGKQLILFGKMSNFEEKFNAIDLLYSEVFSKTGWNYYNKIDLRYEGKIICTKNKQ